MIHFRTGTRVWTVLLALALLLSHGLGTRHSHASGRPHGTVGAACRHHGSLPHLEEAPGESGFCLACALLLQAPASSPVQEFQIQAHTVETRSVPPSLPPARPLHLGRPGRSPPAA
jgi:hypothetical protein